MPRSDHYLLIFAGFVGLQRLCQITANAGELTLSTNSSKKWNFQVGIIFPHPQQTFDPLPRSSKMAMQTYLMNV